MILNPPGDALIADLKGLLGPHGWRAPEPGDLDEPRGRATGRAALVLRPARVDQVSQIVRMANEARVGVVARGGGTGLALGALAPDGPTPLVISFERMAAIRDVDPAEEAMIVEAGAVLADIQLAAEQAGRRFPLALASQGSARIGGLLATNAGGVNVLRYGNARDLVLGVEAVMADGSIHHGLKTLRKDNTGYDLRHLLIGSEGTLGVITAVALKLFPQPVERASAFCAVPHPKAAGALLRALRPVLGGSISAFELMSATGFDFLAAHCPGTPKPPVGGEWAVLIEAEDRGVGEALEGALAQALERGLAADAVIAQSEAQRAAFWRIREEIPVANRRVGAIASHDVSLPLGAIPRFIAAAGAALRARLPNLRINCFGHLGDGNLHYNLFPPQGETRAAHADLAPALTGIVHDLVSEMDGSFAAEHGVGRLKAAELARRADPAKLAAMRAIKAALDPNGVLNPGAVLE